MSEAVSKPGFGGGRGLANEPRLAARRLDQLLVIAETPTPGGASCPVVRSQSSASARRTVWRRAVELA